MRIEYEREVQPERVRAAVHFTDADIAAAFLVADPDEVLFYRLFSPAWEGLEIPEQLRILARVAELTLMARSLNLTADQVLPK